MVKARPQWFPLWSLPAVALRLFRAACPSGRAGIKPHGPCRADSGLRAKGRITPGNGHWHNSAPRVDGDQDMGVSPPMPDSVTASPETPLLSYCVAREYAQAGIPFMVGRLPFPWIHLSNASASRCSCGLRSWCIGSAAQRPAFIAEMAFNVACPIVCCWLRRHSHATLS